MGWQLQLSASRLFALSVATLLASCSPVGPGRGDGGGGGGVGGGGVGGGGVGGGGVGGGGGGFGGGAPDGGPAEIDLLVGGPWASPGGLLNQGRVFGGAIWFHPLHGNPIFTSRLVSPPHRLGALRYVLENLLTTPGLNRTTFQNSVPQLIAKLGDLDFVDAWKANGGTLILNFFGTPDWLAIPGARPTQYCADRVSYRPPSDLQAWKDSVVVPVTTALVARFGTGQRYEVWNEPTTCTWLGTTAEYLALYAATAAGIRQVDPTARVGGPSHADDVSTQWTQYDVKDAGQLPFVQSLIRFAARSPGGRLPLDFVSLHSYQTSPNPNARFHETQLQVVRGWLSDAGYPSTTEFINDEWNYDAYYQRDAGPIVNYSYLDAVYCAQTLMAFDSAGYANQSAQAIEDTGTDVASMTFAYGHPLPRPGYPMFEMFSELSGEQLEVDAGHPWSRAVAFRDGKKVSVVAASFPDRDEWSIGVGFQEIARTDPSIVAVLVAQPAVLAALVQFLKGSSMVLPASVASAFSPSQRAVIGTGKALVDEGRMRRSSWGVTGEAVDALSSPGRRVAWRVTLPTPGAPVRVIHRAIDSAHSVNEATLATLSVQMKASARASACASATRIIQQSATPALVCPALNTFCSTGNSTGVAQPPVTGCTGFEVFALEFTEYLDFWRTDGFLVSTGATGPDIAKFRAEHATDLTEYSAAWQQMWLSPVLQPFEEDLTSQVKFSGGEASVAVLADPYSLHRFTFTLP